MKKMVVFGVLAVTAITMMIGVLIFVASRSKTPPANGAPAPANSPPVTSAPTPANQPSAPAPASNVPASSVPAPANTPAVPARTAPTGAEYLLGKKYTDLQSADACPAGYAVIVDQPECDKAAVTLIETTHNLPAGHPLLAAPNTVSSRLDNVKHLPRYVNLKDMKECGSRCGASENPKGCALREHGSGLVQVGFNSHEGTTGAYVYDPTTTTRNPSMFTTTPYCKRV